ncbi:MAG: protein-L-isoaspartate(D-aspartate) O-methyltransferase [Acidiferrobacterales bacterium]
MTFYRSVIGVVVGLCLPAFLYVTPAQAEDSYAETRLTMVRAIEAGVRATSLELDKEALDPRVLTAMKNVPRHEFVPVYLRMAAYANRPLPIGHGQTISQPYIVAIMTDLLKVQATDRVLEVGTGSGYQAAIMAELADKIFTIEIIKPLAKQARTRLQRLRYHNVQVMTGDGYYGWKQHAPFDAIIVTAAASHVPPPLIRQLKPGGRMMIPVGTRFLVQQLLLVQKDARGKITTRQVLPVRFVPLTGEH